MSDAYARRVLEGGLWDPNVPQRFTYPRPRRIADAEWDELAARYGLARPVNATQRRLLRLTDEQTGLCFYCREPLVGLAWEEINTEHVFARSMRPRFPASLRKRVDGYWNLVATHTPCNQAKGDRVPSHADVERLILQKRLLESPVAQRIWDLREKLARLALPAPSPEQWARGARRPACAVWPDGDSPLEQELGLKPFSELRKEKG